MNKQNNTSQETPEYITADDLLGKTVIDSEGGILGVTNQLLIHPTKLELSGIAVDKGFLKKGLLIGKDHLDRVTKHAIFLDTVPGTLIKGLTVYDVDGAKAGRVTEVTLYPGTNRIASLTIKINEKMYGVIPAEMIAQIGTSVLLKKKKKEIEKA